MHSEPTERACTLPCIPTSRDPSHTEWYVMCPTNLTTGFSLFHSPLCNITLENTTLHKPWEDNQTETCSQGQGNTVPIASFDDKVFPTQAIWIYIKFKPKSQIKMKCELTSCEGSQRELWTFCLSGYPGTWQSFELEEAALPTLALLHRKGWRKAAESRYS